jgi:hypothetical protein
MDSTDRWYEPRELPNQATGLQGIRTWFFGRREYAHPALRWASLPLFRLAWIPFAANVAMEYRNTTLFVLFAALCGSSLCAEAINCVLLRQRRAPR